MCLFPASKKIAQTDITVYKVVIRNKYSHLTRTLMREVPIDDDILAGKFDYMPEYTYDPVDPKVVDRGFVHAYTNRFSAMYMHYLHASSDPCRIVEMYECFIPKGTEYYVGYDNGHSHLPSAAAKKIRFVSKVKVTWRDHIKARKEIFKMSHNNMFSPAGGNQ